VGLLLVLGLVPLLAAALVATLLGGSTIIGQLDARVEAASQQAALEIDSVIGNQVSAMGLVARAPEILAAAQGGQPPAAVAGTAQDLQAMLATQGVDGVVLADLAGTPVASVGVPISLSAMPTGWQAQLAGGGALGTAAATGAGPPALDLAVPVLGADGQAGGFLVEQYSLGGVGASLGRLATAQGMSILVLDSEARLVLGWTSPMSGMTATPVTSYHPTAPVAADVTTTLRRGQVLVDNAGGVAGYASVTDVGWVARAALPASALGPITGLDVSVLATAGGLALLFLGGVALVDRSLRRQARGEAELMLQAAMMAHAAMHDPLTRLPNRMLFNDRLQHGISSARRAGRSMAVLVLDIDGFKAFNDTLGHAVGDALLRETAARLQSCVRASDTVARLGGDEFVIVGVDADRADAELIRAKIQERMAEPFSVEGEQVAVRLSIGLAIFPDDGSETSVLLRQADIAMYREKRARHITR
jgi:diguanylate cyclase (GGDEF)-like protein